MTDRCRTCKHWRIDEEDDPVHNLIVRPIHPSTFERLTEDEQRELHGFLVRICHAPKMVFYEHPEKDGAAVIDGSEYMAKLVTAEDFGCLLHEPDIGK